MFSIRRLLAHFFAVLISAFLVLTVSLHVEVYIQGAPGLIEQVILVSLMHIFIVFVVLNVRTLPDLDVRINPYISTVEWLFNVPQLDAAKRNRRNWSFKFAPYFVEIVAQALGATLASVLFYATISTSVDYTFNTAPIINQSVGWTFVLEIAASFLIAWIYFHNYYFRFSYQLPWTVASALGIMSGILFPFHGVSTFNPFRVIASCAPKGTCTNEAATWVLYVGPLVGIVLGWAISLLTRMTTKENEKKVNYI